MDETAARPQPGSLREPDPTVLPRLVCAVGVAALLAVNLGWAQAAMWLVAATVGEAAVHLAGRPFARSLRRSRLQHVILGASIFAQTSVWTAPAAMFWLTGQPPLLAVAVGVLAVQLFHASTFAYRDGVSIFVCGAPPAAMMLVMPVVFAPFGLVAHLTLVLGALLAVFYAGFVARVNLRMLRALKAVQAELATQSLAATAASQAKSAFLAQMSHELRTPMNGVLGMAHVLRTTPLSEAQQRHVDMLVESGDALLAILNDILDLSKVEAGKLELHPEPFGLADAARQVGRLWAEIARSKGVELTVRMAPGAPDWVVGDVLRVRQILLNLVSNAVKFTAQGEVVLAVDAGQDGVVIEVRDTGAGIDPEARERLFAPFAQADASIAGRYGGTGLGLSICRNLTALMGGRISVDSEVGRGSTFRVELPLPAAEAPAAAAEAGEAPSDGLAGARVLVVDDNQVNQAVAQAILAAAGADVTLAGDGLEALQALADRRFDAVLMDVHMPRMGGVEATARIRRGEAGPADVPIIALTADAMAGERDRLAALGFDDLQPKPIAPAELLAALSRALGRRREAAERVA
jgi:signal transduction histidine kinase/ActR/RegA family two-component response regulator